MRVRTFLRVSAMASMIAAGTSCSSASEPSNAANEVVTQPIGPEGGKIEVGGAVITFPKGAVAASTTVTISVGTQAVPEGFVALSQRFTCGPTGTSFAVPVEMRMPFTDDGKGGTLFWQSGGDPTFKDLGGRVEGKTMVATIMHFSEGFVGRRK